MKHHLCLPLVLATLFAHCRGDEGRPLLSFIVNNRTRLLLKGTYASDRPLEAYEINNNVLFQDVADAPDTSGAPSYDNLPILLDIGEIRLSSKIDFVENVTDTESAQAFWDVLSPERQVYCSHPYSLEANNDRCYQTGGLVNYQEFMNGAGAVYPASDVGAGIYRHSGVYVRAIATGYAMLNGAPTTDEFDNHPIIGKNVIARLNYDPGIDPTQKAVLSPQFFPLHYWWFGGAQSALQMTVDSSYSALVVEMRFNIKENLMLHGYTDADGAIQTVATISDWRRPHESQIDLGGSVLTRTRMYYPDFTTDVRICGGVKSVRHYYSVYIQDEDLKEEILPLAATPTRNGADNVVGNLMAGTYTVQCRYDCVYDGYPETVLSETTLFLESGTGAGVGEACNLDFTCGDAFPADVDGVACSAP